MISKFDKTLQELYGSLVVEGDVVSVGQKVADKADELEGDPTTPKPTGPQKNVRNLVNRLGKERKKMMPLIKKGLTNELGRLADTAKDLKATNK